VRVGGVEGVELVGDVDGLLPPARGLCRRGESEPSDLAGQALGAGVVADREVSEQRAGLGPGFAGGGELTHRFALVAAQRGQTDLSRERAHGECCGTDEQSGRSQNGDRRSPGSG